MKDIVVKRTAIDLPKGGSPLLDQPELDQPEFVYAKQSIQNLASLPGQTVTVTKVLRGYTAPGNLEPLRVLAVTILADLARLSDKQGIEVPESGFLQDLDLSDLQLQAQDFSHTDLGGSRIIRTNLSRAKFVAADMQNVLIERSTLDSALIWNSRLDNAKIKSSSLRGSLIVQTNLRQVLCRESSFENATIFASILDGSLFQSCSFHRANIVAAHFRKIVTLPSMINKDNRCEGSGIDFLEANFSWLFPSGSSEFYEVRAMNEAADLLAFFFPKTFPAAPKIITNFTEAGLAFADFSRACFTRTGFQASTLRGAKFNAALFFRIAYPEAGPEESLFRGADLECASFDGAHVRGVRGWKEAKNVREASFRGVVGMDPQEGIVVSSQSSPDQKAEEGEAGKPLCPVNQVFVKSPTAPPDFSIEKFLASMPAIRIEIK